MNREQLLQQLDLQEQHYLRAKEVFLSDGVISDDEQRQLDVIEQIIQTIRLQVSATTSVITTETTSRSGAGDGPGSPEREVTEDREWDPDEDLSVGDGDEIFEVDYMDRVMEAKPTGSDSHELNEAMENLLKHQGGQNTDQYLQIIATETRMSFSQTKAQYKKFLALQQQQRTHAAQKEGDYPLPEMIAESQLGDYLGSTTSLRYGKMVGDHFGINPVFGAMLNPTGGIVGSGNSQIYDGDPDDPIVKHGIAHDAAGYLLNYHGDGPGYDYLGREGRDTESEYVGQQAGIHYWLDKDNSDDVTSDLMRTTADAWGLGLDTIDEVSRAYDTARQAADVASDHVREGVDAVTEWANETEEEARERVEARYNELVQRSESLQTQSEQFVQDQLDSVRQQTGEIDTDVGELVEEVDQVVSETVSAVETTVSRAAATSWSTANDAYDYADEKLAEAEQYFQNLWN